MNHQEITIPIPGFKIAAKAWGDENNPPLLALHGWLDNAGSFDLIAPSLAEDFYVIAFDAPGHGLSSHLAEGAYYQFLDLIFCTKAILESLQIEKVSLLGHSMGAAAFSLFPSVFPETVVKLALIEGLGPTQNEAHEFAAAFRRSCEIRLLDIKQATRFPDKKAAIKARQSAGDISEASATILAQRGLIKENDSIIWNHDQRLHLPTSHRLTPEQIAACLRQIDCPCGLLIANDPSKAYLYYQKLFEERVAHVPELSLYKLSGGHHLHLENPSEASAILKEFLCSV